MPTKRKAIVAASRPSANTYRATQNDTTETVASALARSVRAAKEVTVGDQVPPCAILWTDPKREWEGALNDLKKLLPEMFVFGTYAPDSQTGPAIWLRAVEGGTVEPKPPKGNLPIFYIPGVSKQQLREVEDCPPELQPLVELQFRGTVWAHPNGKDWTPLAFVSAECGLGLDVGRDEATTEALLRALPALLNETTASLQTERLDAEFFNNLLSPDLLSEVLRWMDAPKEAKARKDKGEWKAFCDQCVANLRFHPDKDGELEAAKLLGQRQREWAKVWTRFADAPRRYPGVVRLLEQASPAAGGELGLVRETLPSYNAQDEAALAKALLGLKNKRADEAANIILGLEKTHGQRRNWVWRELDKAQLAVALEHLSLLATLIEKPLAAASVDELGELYAKAGWEVDDSAVRALACCTSPDHEDPICTAVRSLYLPWLEESARNLQSLKKQNPGAMRPRFEPVEATNGRVVLFADGLRFDVGRRLASGLKAHDLNVSVDWDWTAFPSVTATGKPFASPVAGAFVGGEADDKFGVTIASTKQIWTQERFEALLAENGIEVIKGHDGEHAAKKGWLEAGTLDKHGHTEGWKLANSVEKEVQDLVNRIRSLFVEGWKEVLVVTDHGWLLMPDGLPKVELPKFLAEHRWGRCAAMKQFAVTNLPLVPWHWNEQVSVASPPGTGCFIAGKEYTHGGISAQEMVVPRILVRSSQGAARPAAHRRSEMDRPALPRDGAKLGSGMTVDVRGRAADKGSTKVEGKKAKEVGADGTVSLAVPDDRDEGAAAVIVLMAADETVVESQPTVIGENR